MTGSQVKPVVSLLTWLLNQDLYGNGPNPLIRRMKLKGPLRPPNAWAKIGFAKSN